MYSQLQIELFLGKDLGKAVDDKVDMRSGKKSFKGFCHNIPFCLSESYGHPYVS